MGITEALEKLRKSDDYPFHMPGHKRRMAGYPLSQAYEIDITEIDGFDNLHYPEGIIREAMEEARELYGSKESFFLINGSTAGILSAIHSCTGYGDQIVISRNAHRSVYHGIALLNLKSDYLYPQQIPEWNMAKGVSVEEVERAVQKNPHTKAVLITSPTYEGFVSPIREIADFLHHKKIPLIVDEAHGAHFPFSGFFPESALNQGADLVIQSLHKTLPALTQTAILHLQGDLVDIHQLKQFLRIFQTSSPSYLLLSSIESCLQLVQKRGEELWKPIAKEREIFFRETQNLKGIRIWKEDEQKDPLKLLLSPFRGMKDNLPYTGVELYQELLEGYRLQLEMATADYALGILTCMDEPSGLRRLKEALFAIDGCLTIGEEKNRMEKGMIRNSRPVSQMTIGDALRQKTVWIPLTLSAGRVAAGFINLYPPGIPLILPGEVIGEEFVATLLLEREHKRSVQGIEAEKIEVVA